MLTKRKISVLKEILDSVDLEDRPDAINKYGSYLAIATTLETEFLKAAEEQKWQRKNWQDLVKSHSSFLAALIPDEDGGQSPAKHLENAGAYLVKVSPLD